MLFVSKYRNNQILFGCDCGNELKIDRSTYEILQVLGLPPMDKMTIKELFTNKDYNDVKEPNYNQLPLNLI